MGAQAEASQWGETAEERKSYEEDYHIREKKKFLSFLAIYIFMAATAGLIGFLNVAESEEARSVYAPAGSFLFCLLWIGFLVYIARLGKKR